MKREETETIEGGGGVSSVALCVPPKLFLTPVTCRSRREPSGFERADWRGCKRRAGRAKKGGGSRSLPMKNRLRWCGLLCLCFCFSCGTGPLVRPRDVSSSCRGPLPHRVDIASKHRV